MGIERSGENKILGLRFTSSHKRSKSLPVKKGVEEHDNQLEALDSMKLDMGYLTECTKARNEVHTTLKQEILQLERRLQDQFEVRCTLEKALGYRPSPLVNANDNTMSKPATELIKEIAVLELEVVYLEQHLLSLYRKAFDQHLSSVSPSTKEETVKLPQTTPQPRLTQVLTKTECSAVQSNNSHEPQTQGKEHKGNLPEDMHMYSGVYRCHSSLSHYSAFTRSSPPSEPLTKPPRACHSQPLSMMEYGQSNPPNIVSLAEHLGTRISDHVLETPNKLSEDMIKCISAIYCKLADPPSLHPGLLSPTSSLSSTRLKEFSGPYSTMVEVTWIYREIHKSGDADKLLQHFRSLISRLEEVNPGKLKHEEKLAFWINVHNALVMHAFLAYGIPQNNVKRTFLLLKVNSENLLLDWPLQAAYNVGGYTVTADTIQNIILGCRISRPGQWLRLFFSQKSKFRSADGRVGYAMEHPEPLSHFALCSGNHSDPAVRVYTAKRVIQELEAAKDEYIRATFGVRKDKKLLLPKLVESFTKDLELCPSQVMEMIQDSLPESLRKSVKKWQVVKSRKCIEWIPHNFNFRYLISKDMLK
ncbi:hypothetical protein Ahy_Scaffold1g106851 isoform A [Arachis hypogaea]|uniref:DUF547 domain-containing protein n=1 Tax=Arachis hypogaea TaxID=3818 RepID=A0A444WSM4_ARAHY|nr:hypothetical protein Ahy_Scaffold1g106851 isoform A [Arachis hypogaea]